MTAAILRGLALGPLARLSARRRHAIGDPALGRHDDCGAHLCGRRYIGVDIEGAVRGPGGAGSPRCRLRRGRRAPPRGPTCAPLQPRWVNRDRITYLLGAYACEERGEWPNSLRC